MGRGRLLFPYKVTIAQLDTKAIRDDGNYDDIFKAPTLESTSDGIGTINRQERTEIDVPAQVMTETFEALNQLFNGNIPDSEIIITFHFRDLKRLGLVETATGREGREALKVNDRIVRIKDRWGNGVLEPPNPPGLFITELRPTGFMEQRNLVCAVLGDREQGKDVQ